MKVFKFYDAFCDKCGNWYGNDFLPPRVSNKEKAIKEMKYNGWKVINGRTICHNCSVLPE